MTTKTPKVLKLKLVPPSHQWRPFHQSLAIHGQIFAKEERDPPADAPDVTVARLVTAYPEWKRVRIAQAIFQFAGATWALEAICGTADAPADFDPDAVVDLLAVQVAEARFLIKTSGLADVAPAGEPGPVDACFEGEEE